MEREAPKSVEAFRLRLRELGDGLPRRLGQCASYLADHSDRIALSTVGELARSAGVQPSALIRFCQVMGFSGFSEMQKLFKEGYGQAWPDYATRLDRLAASGPDSAAGILAEFVEASRLSLERFTLTFDPAHLPPAVEALAGARTIHIMGRRRAFAVATYLAHAFEQMGVSSHLLGHAGGLGVNHALQPGDALLAVSFAPYSAETVAFAERARAGGVPVVAITDAGDGPLAALASAVLPVTEFDFGNFRSLSATMALSLALAVSVGRRREETRRPALPDVE